MPQFLLPESPLLYMSLPKLVLHCLLCETEATLCKEVTLQRQTQGNLESGQSDSFPFRDTYRQARAQGLASGTFWSWTGGPGQSPQRCPLCRQLLLSAGGGLNSWTHCWGPASWPGSACQGPAGCHPHRQGEGTSSPSGHHQAGVSSQTGPSQAAGQGSRPASAPPKLQGH